MKWNEIELIVLKFWDSCECGYGVFDLPWTNFASDTVLIF